MATRFLLDANLSPLTARYLVDNFGLDVSDLVSQGLGNLTDSEVASMATQEGRVLILTLGRSTIASNTAGLGSLSYGWTIRLLNQSITL